MADDLAEICERLDFCDAELKILDNEIQTFLEAAVGLRRVDHLKHFAIQMRVTQPLPVAIRSRLGTIIHEARSCLDSLACVLANRNENDSKGVYFPISKTLAIFEEDGRKKIKKLSESDQKSIADLRPYGGGDDFLFGMHEFDRTRKHQRLGLSYPGFGGMSAFTAGRFHLIEMGGAPRLTAEWQTIGTFSLDSVFSAQFIAVPSFEDPAQLKGRGILKGARAFISQAREIVRKFQCVPDT